MEENNKLSTESAMSSIITLQKLLRNYTFSNKKKLSRFIGEGNDTPVQYSCLENPMDGGPGRLQSMGSLGVGHN